MPPEPRGPSRRALAGMLLSGGVALSAGCGRFLGGAPRHVVIVGAGPGGLAAAHAALAAGAKVTLLEANPGIGGAAVFGQAITAVPGDAGLSHWTEEAGAADEPDALAARERYVRRVQVDVVDYLAGLGVRWSETWNPHDDGSTLYQPEGGGTAVCNAVKGAIDAAGVVLLTTARAGGLRRLETGGIGIDLDSGEQLEADAVILATGGFMGDLDEVRARLELGTDTPLLRGAPVFADGAGLELGESLGGAVRTPSQGILYAHGVATSGGTRAVMLIEAHRAWPIAADGTALPFLRSPRGSTGRELAKVGGEAWMIIDGPASRSMSFWDWESMRMVRARQLLQRESFPTGEVAALAEALGVPEASITEGLRLPTDPMPRSPQDTQPRPLEPRGTLTALPVRTTTAKSLTGLETDLQGAVTGADGNAIPGLFAVGEVAGFGHPYAGVAYDSTMVAGAVLTGRIAGAAAARG